MKVLIIEDEPIAQEELERILIKNYPDYKILDKIDSVERSIEWLQNNQCDLIFMDIQLSDGRSFEIFDTIDLKTPIIFTTAYDEFAIQAFKVNSIGYILKPIDEAELKHAIDKLSLNNFNPYPDNSIVQLLSKLEEKPNIKNRFVVKIGDKYQYITTKDIAYIYSEDKVTFIKTTNGKKYIIDDTLDSIEQKLDSKQFFRLARNIISSIDAISSVSKYFNSRLLVKLEPEFHNQILISRVRVPDFLNWMDS